MAEFNQLIAKWIQVEDEIKKYNVHLSKLRETRTQLNTQIAKQLIDTKKQDAIIRTSNCNLRLYNTKISSPISFKYLEQTLPDLIDDDGQIKQIIKYLKSKRNVKITTELRKVQ